MEAECCVCSTAKYSDRNITPCGSGVSEVNRGWESSCERNEVPGRKGRIPSALRLGQEGSVDHCFPEQVLPQYLR